MPWLFAGVCPVELDLSSSMRWRDSVNSLHVRAAGYVRGALMLAVTKSQVCVLARAPSMPAFGPLPHIGCVYVLPLSESQRSQTAYSRYETQIDSEVGVNSLRRKYDTIKTDIRRYCDLISNAEVAEDIRVFGRVVWILGVRSWTRVRRCWVDIMGVWGNGIQIACSSTLLGL